MKKAINIDIYPIFDLNTLYTYYIFINDDKFQHAAINCEITSLELTEKKNISTTWKYHFIASGRYEALGQNGYLQISPCQVDVVVKSVGEVVGNSWFVEDVRPIFALA